MLAVVTATQIASASTASLLCSFTSGFETDWAWQLLERCQHVAPLELAAKGHFTLRVDAVDLKDRLRNIETDRRNPLHNLAPPSRGGLNAAGFHGAHVPVEEPSTAS